MMAPSGRGSRREFRSRGERSVPSASVGSTEESRGTTRNDGKAPVSRGRCETRYGGLPPLRKTRSGAAEAACCTKADTAGGQRADSGDKPLTIGRGHRMNKRGRLRPVLTGGPAPTHADVRRPVPTRADMQGRKRTHEGENLVSYLVKRLLMTCLLLLALLSTVFFVLHAVPGNPVDFITNPDLDDAERELIQQRLGQSVNPLGWRRG